VYVNVIIVIQTTLYNMSSSIKHAPQHATSDISMSDHGGLTGAGLANGQQPRAGTCQWPLYAAVLACSCCIRKDKMTESAMYVQ